MTSQLVETADDKRAGLTFGEVAAWVERAKKIGVSDDAPVKAEAGFRGQLVQVSTS